VKKYQNVDGEHVAERGNGMTACKSRRMKDDETRHARLV